MGLVAHTIKTVEYLNLHKFTIKMKKLKQINWTPDMLGRFKIIYDSAVSGKHNSFVFEGNEFVTPYAKYLIEFLESKFK